MAIINIYSKPRNGRAILIHTIEIQSGEFGDAVEATRTYTLSLGKPFAKIFWNWADSAWDRQR